MNSEKVKIICGDARTEITKIPDKSVDMVYIDIPYFFVYGTGSDSKLGQRIRRKRSELVQNEMLNGIDYSILDTLCNKMKKINIFVWCSKLQVPDILNYFKKRGCFHEILVWCKTNPIPQTNNTWLPDVEYCLYFREKGVKLNAGYENKHKYFVSPINKKEKDLYKHPTIKPLEMVEKHILHTTQENDTVLDCYMGSGTTGVACAKHNRRFIGIDINPEFCETARERVGKELI